MSLLSNFQTIQNKVNTANDWAEAILNHQLKFDSTLNIYYYGPNLTDHTSNKKNGSLSGSYSTSSQGITFNGGYGTTGSISNVRGTWEVYCKINSDFTPVNTTDWYSMSCIMGCELNGVYQDFGIVLLSGGNFALGYASSSGSDTYYTAGIKGNDGNWHHLVVTIDGATTKLYIDGVQKISTTKYTSGSKPSQYGLFWNKSGSATAVKGTLGMFRYFTEPVSASQVKYLYTITKNGLR